MLQVTGIFGHKNIARYRPIFNTNEEHDAFVIEQYLNIIKKRDTVYFLGDIVFDDIAVQKVAELPGYKILVLGNHDLERGGHDMKMLWDAFDRVVSLTTKKGCWLSHAPIHPDELRGKFNIHGHTHNHVIDDYRYANVCLENTNYRPVDLIDVKATMERGEIFGILGAQDKPHFEGLEAKCEHPAINNSTGECVACGFNVDKATNWAGGRTTDLAKGGEL